MAIGNIATASYRQIKRGCEITHALIRSGPAPDHSGSNGPRYWLRNGRGCLERTPQRPSRYDFAFCLKHPFDISLDRKESICWRSHPTQGPSERSGTEGALMPRAGVLTRYQAWLPPCTLFISADRKYPRWRGIAQCGRDSSRRIDEKLPVDLHASAAPFSICFATSRLGTAVWCGLTSTS